MAATLCRSLKYQKVIQNFKFLCTPFSSTSRLYDDKITHTGQKFDDDNDPRLARFVDKEKQVNPHFAIDLINSVPPKPVKERVVSCDGGGGALGHPKVYINLDQPGPKACGYCGLRFVLEHQH